MTSIAVIVPCYNLGRTLDEALDSIIEQARPADEIVIVDDGSTDLYTRHVLATIERPRTRVVRTPNRGLPAARNHGIRLTSSPYLVTLDADDRLDRSYLEKTAALLDADPTIGFVSTSIQAFGERQYIWTPPPCSISNALTRGSAHPASMFRRELWNTVGGFDEVSPIHGCEDMDFWLSAMIAGFGGVVIPEPLLLYRVRHDSMHQVNVASGRHLKALEALFRKHQSAIEQLGPDVLIEKERFRLELTRYVGELEQRKAAATDRIRALDAQIEAEAAALADQPRVNRGDLARSSPISPVWGFDRGLPVDRLYIREFLERHRHDVRGRVLEVKDSGYTNSLKDDRVVEAQVIDIDPTNPLATIVTDLTKADDVPGDQFDCFILTQTLHMIFDIRAALAQAARLLKPGGVLLCSIPAVSRVDYELGGPDNGDYWRLTQGAVRQLFAEIFPVGAYTVDTYGNVATCTAFLYGLAVEDLHAGDLGFHDPWFPLIHCVRAVKPQSRRVIGRAGAAQGNPGVVLLYHRVTTRDVDPYGLCISPGRFREQMRYLKERCHLMSLTDLVSAAKSAALPTRAVAVTFDDAYIDNLTEASPILSEIGVPSTFFANTEQLEEEHEFWWDTLARLFLQEPTLPASMALSEGIQDVQIRSLQDRRHALTAVHSGMRRLPVERRNHVLSSLIQQIQPKSHRHPADRPMTSPELRALASRPGHDVGAHTTHHLSLPSLPAGMQAVEMSGCKTRLEALLDRSVRSIAYPFGEANPQTASIARAAGFTIGVTVANSAVSEEWDPLMVPRVEVADSDFEASLESFLAVVGETCK